MTYIEALSFLDSLSSFGIKPGLTRISALLEQLNNPQQDFISIHIAGTNGKGSTSAMLAEILLTSGCKTGLFTSPHLTNYTERIVVDGQNVNEEDFAAAIEETAKAVDALAETIDRPTQFEVLTAAAFLIFSRRKVEYAVVEAGLGGMLDSTNVITPIISVITNVAFDHAEYCGGTLSGIARHKAGIIKDGVPVVTAAQDMPLKIISEVAETKGADLFIKGEDFTAEFISADGETQKIAFSSNLLGMQNFVFDLALLGIHQVENSALALMTAAIMHNTDERINRFTAVEALKKVHWAGRFEHFRLSFQDIIIDGAHNTAGAQKLRQSLDLYYPGLQRVFVLGILRDKEPDAVLAALVREGDVVIATTPLSNRALSADELAAKAKKCTEYAEAVAEPKLALQRAVMIASGERLVIAAGSLYLIGNLRQIISSTMAKQRQ